MPSSGKDRASCSFREGPGSSVCAPSCYSLWWPLSASLLWCAGDVWHNQTVWAGQEGQLCGGDGTELWGGSSWEEDERKAKLCVFISGMCCTLHRYMHTIPSSIYSISIHLHFIYFLEYRFILFYIFRILRCCFLCCIICTLFPFATVTNLNVSCRGWMKAHLILSYTSKLFRGSYSSHSFLIVNQT